MQGSLRCNVNILHGSSFDDCQTDGLMMALLSHWNMYQPSYLNNHGN